MKMLDSDEQAQKKGIVIIDYWVGIRTIPPSVREAFSNVHIVTESLPVRLVAVHFCYDIAQLRPMMLFIQTALSKDLRLRYRAHYGTLLCSFYQTRGWSGVLRTSLWFVCYLRECLAQFVL